MRTPFAGPAGLAGRGHRRRARAAPDAARTERPFRSALRARLGAPVDDDLRVAVVVRAHIAEMVRDRLQALGRCERCDRIRPRGRPRG
jgi:hypothetical protein